MQTVTCNVPLKYKKLVDNFINMLIASEKDVVQNNLVRYKTTAVKRSPSWFRRQERRRLQREGIISHPVTEVIQVVEDVSAQEAVSEVSEPKTPQIDAIKDIDIYSSDWGEEPSVFVEDIIQEEKIKYEEAISVPNWNGESVSIEHHLDMLDEGKQLDPERLYRTGAMQDWVNKYSVQTYLLGFLGYYSYDDTHRPAQFEIPYLRRKFMSALISPRVDLGTIDELNSFLNEVPDARVKLESGIISGCNVSIPSKQITAVLKPPEAVAVKSAPVEIVSVPARIPQTEKVVAESRPAKEEKKLQFHQEVNVLEFPAEGKMQSTAKFIAEDKKRMKFKHQERKARRQQQQPRAPPVANPDVPNQKVPFLKRVKRSFSKERKDANKDVKNTKK